MATTTESLFPEALRKDSYDWYWESYDEQPKKYTEVFTVKKTTALYEKSTSAIGTGKREEKTSTGKIKEKAPIEGFITYGKIRAFAKMETITREVAEDTQKLSNFLKSQMSQWAIDAEETIEDFCAGVFNYGGHTAGHDVFNNTIAGVIDPGTGSMLYDGKALFAANGTYHTSKGNTNYYNGLGALNISITNLQTAYNRMSVYNNRKEDDSIMRNVPNILLCSPALKFTVDEILKSQDKPDTANRAINVMNNLVQPVYWDYLTDADQWQLVNTKMGGFVLYMRENPEFDLWEDKETKLYKMSIYMRYGIMVKNWRQVVAANYATS
jgi:hypothetical protein